MGFGLDVPADQSPCESLDGIDRELGTILHANPKPRRIGGPDVRQAAYPMNGIIQSQGGFPSNLPPAKDRLFLPVGTRDTRGLGQGYTGLGGTIAGPSLKQETLR